MTTEMPLILVVDDTEGTRYSVCRVLKNAGYRTVEAANGTDGLKLADELVPDLAILDIHLPDMLGFEVCRRIKAAPRTTLIPILQISASYVTAKDKINGLEGGADSYLTHPVEPAVLIATVRSLLRMRDLTREVSVTNERLQLALKSAPIALFELGPDLRYKWMHAPKGRQNPDEMIGKRVDEISSSDATRALLGVQQDVLRTGESARMIYHATVDGVERYLDMRFDAAHAADGSISGIVGVSVDVTEREIAKLETERARDAAENANRAKSQFIANVSHEIRTPIGVIMGFSDLILDGEPNREENMRSVGVIKRNAHQLSKLIDEVLDLSKVEADRMEIESIRFDLVDVIDDVASVLSLQAREKGVALEVRYNGVLPSFIKSDPLRLRQILINMVGNSLKFTERGNVIIDIAAASAPTIGQPVVLTFNVCDTGIGITPEQSARLFEPFVQADATMTRRFGGTGLGLMLSRRLAQALGGDLILKSSTPGQGSIFQLKITDPSFSGPTFEGKREKLAATSINVGDASRLAPPRDLEGISVLLVEDSPDNQIMLQRFLAQAGANVEIASDGRSGVERASSGRYDVVLMDIQMPVLDGYDATRELRAGGFKPPIVALTAHALKGEREKCLAAGFTDYLTKPVNRQLLISKVRSMSETNKPS